MLASTIQQTRQLEKKTIRGQNSKFKRAKSMDNTTSWMDLISSETGAENEHFSKVCSFLSVSGILLNLFLILATCKRGMKTKLKMVVSLAFADALLAAFHLIFVFIQVDSPWSRKSVFKLTINGTSYPGIVGITINNYQLPNGIIGSLFTKQAVAKEQIERHQSVANHLQENQTGILRKDENLISEDILAVVEQILDSFMYSAASQLGVNSTNSETNLSVKVSSKKLHEQFLSAFYLMPNIAAVLSMFFSTFCLTITVWMPLKNHLVLSSKRGTIIVCAIWLFSFLVSLGQLIYKHQALDNGFSVLTTNNSMLQIIVWYATLVVFLIITCMFITIICLLSKSHSLLSCTFTQKRRKSTIRATVTALAVTGTYAICFLPFIWIELLQATTEFSRTRETVWWFGMMQALFILNTNADPIINFSMLPEVTTGVEKLWRRTKRIVMRLST